MMSRWKKGVLAWVAMSGVAMAQTTPNNEQLVQSFRALLSSGSDTQAVIQAVAEAVREALKQGPMTSAQAQTALAAAPTQPASGSSASLSGVAAALTPSKTWADAITLKGDLRYRVETRQDASKGYAGNPDVEYERIRARLGAEAKLNDDVKAVIRLTTDGFKGTTAGGDPVSGNQDLTGLAGIKFFFLDLAYIDWNFFGEGNSELHGLAGKMVNPFITMNDDLAWDPDLTPEGAGFKGTLAVSDSLTLLGNGGYFLINNQNNTNQDNKITMFGLQGAVRYEFAPEAALTLGISDYCYRNVKGSPVVDWAVASTSSGNGSSSAYGNSTAKVGSGKVTNIVWATGFNLIQPFAQLDLYPTVFGRVVPVSVFGQLINNSDADRLNAGEMCGISIGKAKNPQTFEVGASYAKLEKDATFGAWTDSDRWGGGTDGSGYKLYGKYMILKNLMGSVTYFQDDKKISAASPYDYNRWQIDLTASF